jgi:ABC-type dipeptide/oligopeptide/nickel transport system permease subunit
MEALSRRRLSFIWHRFRGFWSEYKQSKRGLLGILIIVLFGLVAVFAPLLSPYDPLEPRYPGFYPAQQPRLAEQLCVPIWYKSVLGETTLSENMLVIADHEFHSLEVFEEKWIGTSTPPQANVLVDYTATGGSHDNDGAVEITYTRAETEAPPVDGKVIVTLSRAFEYPYLTPPNSIWTHYSLSIKNRTVLPTLPITAKVNVRKGDESFKIVDWRTELTSLRLVNKWKHDRGISTGFAGTMEETIFTDAGPYTYEFVVTILDDGNGEMDLTIYVDNLQMILYGKAFGILGTDANENSPRDLFTMLLYGTRISFLIGLLTAFFGVLIGLAVGLVAGYVGGLVDEALMRFSDFLLVLPNLPLLIVLVTVLGPSIWNVIGVLIFLGWMGFSRTVRSMVLSLRERPFIESAKAAGAGTFYVIQRHIVPNVFALVYITLATSVPGAILSEASLAWLGLGDINVPSWGMMLYDFGRANIALVRSIGEYWFWVIPPGIAIALMAMAFILMGFSLDEILNPRLRQRR